MKYFVLFYDVVNDMVNKRAPYPRGTSAADSRGARARRDPDGRRGWRSAGRRPARLSSRHSRQLAEAFARAGSLRDRTDWSPDWTVKPWTVVAGRSRYLPGSARSLRTLLVYGPGRDPLTFFQGLAQDLRRSRIRADRPASTCFSSTIPRHIRDILVTHQRKFMKGRGLERAKRLLGEGLLTSEGAVHVRQRRLMQPAFHRERIAVVRVGDDGATPSGSARAGRTARRSMPRRR